MSREAQGMRGVAGGGHIGDEPQTEKGKGVGQALSVEASDWRGSMPESGGRRRA